MADLTRNFDWASTSIGAPEAWPVSLITTINSILRSRFPMFLWWGDELIQFYNDAYRPSLGNEGKHPMALGQKAVDCWPEIWEVIKPLIDQVLTKGESTYSENQLIPIYRNGNIEEVYWTFSYSPVDDDDHQIKGVLVVCNETTPQIRKLNNLNQSRVDLERSQDSLTNLIKQAPVAIGYLKDKDMIIEAANRRMLKIWGKDESIIGLPLQRALPELEGQPFLKILDNVFTTGQSFNGTDYRAVLEHEGVLKEMFFDFVYQRITINNEDAHGIIVVANDVTERIVIRKQTEQSENRLRQIVMKSPYIMLVLKGADMVIEIANQALYSYWNKTDDILGKPLLEVLPELKNQAFPGLLKKVFGTGVPYGEKEVLNYFETAEGVIEKYVSYVYEPIIDEDGQVSGILVAAEDMTQEVRDRTVIKNAEETLRLSREAARLGTFDMDLINNTMFWDARCRELFGIQHSLPVSYEKDFLPGLHPEDASRIANIIEDVLNKERSGGVYDVEYRTVGAQDNITRWVRAKGQAFFDAADRPIRFIGSVLEITDKKIEDMRRDDFFAMASHELKTPLTAIKAYTQLLLVKAKRDTDGFNTETLLKMDKSVNNMTKLIQGFLNNARILEGKLDIRIEPVNITALIQEIGEDARFLSSGHQLVIMPGEELWLAADPEKISLVLENLISNAIKYSPEGGKIIIGCALEDELAEIYVQDEGIGISESDQRRLFERFYRVEDEKLKNVAGFGIGLYLVAEILRFHNSQIKVKSAPAKGSRFSFRLPIVPAAEKKL